MNESMNPYQAFGTRRRQCRRRPACRFHPPDLSASGGRRRGLPGARGGAAQLAADAGAGAAMIGGRYGWLIVMGAFMGRAIWPDLGPVVDERGTQYMGLGLYVVAEL